MKKLILFVLLAVLCLAFIGCSQNAPFSAEQTEWSMTTIQHGENGEVWATGTSQMRETYPEAKTMQLTCSLNGTAFTIQDLDSAQNWTGTYRTIEQGPDGTTIYELAFSDGTEGHAVSGITTYADGSQEATLIVTAEDYTVNFSGGLLE